MAFRTFILLCRHRHSDARHFHHPKEALCPRAVTPHSFRQCRAASPLLSASMDLATLGISQKRTHMMASILSTWFLRVILAGRVTMSVRAVLIDATYEQFPPRQAHSHRAGVTWGDALCPATLRPPADSGVWPALTSGTGGNFPQLCGAFKRAGVFLLSLLGSPALWGMRHVDQC